MTPATCRSCSEGSRSDRDDCHAGTRRTRGPFDTDERLLQQYRVGPVDRLPAGGILALLPQLPDWPAATVHRTRRLNGAGTILDWLNAYPGEGWQDRWTVSGADRDTGWIEMLAPGDNRRAITKRQEHIAGLGCLLMCRVVLPSYDFLAAYRATGLLDRVREIMRPEIFARLENAAAERGLSGRDRGDALSVISKIVLHTGTDIDALTPGDVLEMFAWSVHAAPPRRQVPGLHAAWDLLGDIGVTPAGTTLRSAQRRGQRTTAELVDDYGISCHPIRDVLVRYLDERRPALDYKTLAGLAGELAGTFWADIERHHPGIDTLHLPGEIAQAWKERARVITDADGTIRERKNIHALLMRVRAFYLDIQQWALEDPSWVPWAVPSPVRRNDTRGYEKARRKTVAAMHQRVRERLPHLPALADAAGRCLAETTALLAAAAGCEPGEVFDHAGSRYRRKALKSAGLSARHQGNPSVTAENLVTGKTVNLTRREDEAFWAWAIVETLRLSGIFSRGANLDIRGVFLVSPGQRLINFVQLRHRCGARMAAGMSPAACRGVELGHEFAVGSPGGGEFLVAFFQLEPQVGDLLLEVGDVVAEGVDVGGRAEPGVAPGLLAEHLGQAVFELLDTGIEPDRPLVGGEQVSLQRCPGHGRAGSFAGGRRGGFERVDLAEQVAVPVEEGAVHGCGTGDGRDADLGAVGGGLVERGDDALAAAG